MRHVATAYLIDNRQSKIINKCWYDIHVIMCIQTKLTRGRSHEIKRKPFVYQTPCASTGHYSNT